MLNKILFILVCLGLFLNQAGRISIGNNIAFTILDVSVALLLLYNGIDWVKNKYTITKETFSRPFLIFIAIAVISLLINLWHYTLQQDFVAALYLLRFIMYCLIYLVIKKQFADKKQFIIICLSITSILILLAGLLQYFFYSNLRNLYYLGWDDHLYRLFNTFFDPNFAGAFTVLIFFFFTTLCIIAIKNKNRKLYISLGVLLVIALIEVFLTFSRSSLVMLFVSSLVYFYYLKKIRYFFAIILAIICIYFVVAPNIGTENTDLFRVTSSLARFTSEQTAFDIIAKNPLLGVGFDAYRYAQVKYGYRTVKDIQVSHADSSTDNSFLFVFATTGIFGFVAYLFLQYKILQTLQNESHKKKHIFIVLLTASFIGLYVNSLFINSLFYPCMLLWLMVLMGIRDYM